MYHLFLLYKRFHFRDFEEQNASFESRFGRVGVDGAREGDGEGRVSLGSFSAPITTVFFGDVVDRAAETNRQIGTGEFDGNGVVGEARRGDFDEIFVRRFPNAGRATVFERREGKAAARFGG